MSKSLYPLLIMSLLSSAGLVACSKPSETTPQPETTQTAATTEPSTAPASEPATGEVVKISSLLPMQSYTCLPEQKIIATYDKENPVESQAMLEINGMIHVLYATSKTESIYQTESGLKEGEGMKWVVDADGATLTSVPAQGATTVLYRCTNA